MDQLPTDPGHDAPEKHSFSYANLGGEFTADAQQSEAEPFPPINGSGLQRDFQQIFLLSGENNASREALISALAESYVASTEPATLQTALDYVAQRLDSYRPPRYHKPLTAEDYNRYSGVVDGQMVVNPIQANWQLLNNRIKQAAAGNPQPANMKVLLTNLIRSDLDYQYKPRRGRPELSPETPPEQIQAIYDQHPMQDPHMSIVREYIDGDRLQGSQHLLAIRDEIRDRLDDADDHPQNVADALALLEKNWEDNHPGRSFW